MELLTTKDAAERLGVTVQRIHAFIKDERLPAKRMGRDYVINESDLTLVADRKPGRPPKPKNAGEPATGAAEASATTATAEAVTMAAQPKPRRTGKAQGASSVAKPKPAKKGKAK